MTKRSLITLTFIALLTVIMLPIFAQEEEPTGGQPWDLLNTGQAGLFVFYDLPAGASTTGKPLDAGDFDNNGCGDIAITGQNSTHHWRGSAGHVRIVMNMCEIGGQIAMSEEQAIPDVFSIYGSFSGDMAGTETYVGDFNGDGYDDLLFSAQNHDGRYQNRSNAGAAYVLFGSRNFANHTDVDLLEMPGDVMVFYGAAEEDRLGLWVEGGDFDGDGYHDLLLGVNQGDGEGNNRINAGEIWIIYGAADMLDKYGQMVDMAQYPDDATRIVGVDPDDIMGSTVWGDDIDGDGFADAIVSAGLWRASAGVGGLSFGGADGPANMRYNSGETFIIYGREDLRGEVVDLRTLTDESGQPVDDSITVIYGPDPNDLLGEEIAVGDMDGDGQNDLILGTLIGDGSENDMDEAGEVWVIYSYEPFRGQVIDLADPEPGRAVVIYPDQPDSKAGDTIRAADLDGDGIADLFYGAPDYDPIGYDNRLRPNAGMMAVIFGEEGGLPNDDGRILLFDPPRDLRVLYIIGGDDNDMMPYALAIYDMNGDGVVDIAPNAMGGDGANNDQINAGEIYVIDGAEFLSPDHDHEGTVEPRPTPTPWPTATPLPESTVVAAHAGNRERGQRYFEETCFACHGLEGEGVEGLGLPLIDSPLVMYAPDNELVDFLQTGRSADHPDNVTGVSMPPSGGRPDWGEEELLDIATYLRWLRDNAEQNAP